MAWFVTLIVAGAFAWPLAAVGNAARPPRPARRPLTRRQARVVNVAALLVLLTILIMILD